MQDWKLDPEEVRSYEGGLVNYSLRTHRKQLSYIEPGSIEIYLLHEPTNIEVKGVVSSGGRSKNANSELKTALYEALFKELESKVRAFLSRSEK